MIWGTPILGKRPSAESHLVGGQGGRRNHRHIVHAQRSEAQLMRCQLTAKICRVQPKRRRFAPIQYDGFVNLIPTNPTIPVYLRWRWDLRKRMPVSTQVQSSASKALWAQCAHPSSRQRDPGSKWKNEKWKHLKGLEGIKAYGTQPSHGILTPLWSSPSPFLP